MCGTKINARCLQKLAIDSATHVVRAHSTSADDSASEHLSTGHQRAVHTNPTLWFAEMLP
jgi:hypothetical protein